ncbi:ASKHA domain-containing protein [Methanoculleus chikugoensis]|uniref:Ferredoxin n=1 Tax=Methanoculleus chikugoensis TaxID=118126 RepID=A0ABM7H4M9_9EURY|nr:ASKHA domain-containing protein [Methanoculleus chikugoensis]BBL67730.1 ferredoxin [Methanoculleus chikugoensis]
MPTVTFLPGYRKVTVPEGATLLDAARAAGLSMNVVCGGEGKCGKCQVYVKDGTVSFDREKYRRFFSEEEIARGVCLACRAYVVGDVQVEVPAGSLIEEQKILVEIPGMQEIPLNPAVRKYEVRLEPPSLEDTTPDLGRLLEGIERQGGPPPNRVYAPLGVLCSLPQVLRRSGWHVTATVALVPGGYRLSSVDEGDTTGRLYGAAVDLGTTTIVAYIRSLVDGRILATASNYNRQISCGEDILSRVNFSRRSGLARLQQLAAESINEALTTAADAAGIDREEILEVMIAGNTVMTHLLLGIDPAYMIAEPYIPVVRRMLSTAAGRIGIAAHTNAGVYTFPAVSNFIGGDIIADILAAGMAEREEATLMVDIGTNFEAVLGNSDWMLSCAGAAGPALEGGEVLFGMRANPGAIERVRIDPDTLAPSVSTINGLRPRGICGSGLIDLLAELFRACVIDRTGGINLELDHPRIRKGQYYPEYVVAWKEETSIGKEIVITENDIKSLIMSKAAIHAACMTLLDAAGLAPGDISRVCFSGAFGNYLNKENAVTIGLIPEIPPECIENIGNGAITGANIALVDRRRRKELDGLARRITYIELNADPSFMDRYTSSCFLPHTDIALFPHVQQTLEACRAKQGVRSWQA